MESPQNQVWGPALWMLLHHSTERIGSRSLQRLPEEESRLWLSLLSSLRYSLPCPLCKKHYASYFASASLGSFSKESMRVWLFQLHEKVNLYTNKPYTITLEQLPEIYSIPFQYTKYSSVFVAHMALALNKGWCKREDTHRTMRFLEEMRRFYDFF